MEIPQTPQRLWDFFLSSWYAKDAIGGFDRWIYPPCSPQKGGSDTKPSCARL